MKDIDIAIVRKFQEEYPVHAKTVINLISPNGDTNKGQQVLEAIALLFWNYGLKIQKEITREALQAIKEYQQGLTH